MENNTMAFLYDCPVKGEYMMFPDFLEFLPKDKMKLYEEVTAEVPLDKLKVNLSLLNQPYKVFKRKNKKQS